MPQRNTVLVARATGILGVHVVQQLVANQYDVIGLTRSQVKRTLLEGFGARAVIADVLDAAALEQVLRQTTPPAGCAWMRGHQPAQQGDHSGWHAGTGVPL